MYKQLWKIPGFVLPATETGEAGVANVEMENMRRRYGQQVHEQGPDHSTMRDE